MAVSRAEDQLLMVFTFHYINKSSFFMMPVTQRVFVSVIFNSNSTLWYAELPGKEKNHLQFTNPCRDIFYIIIGQNNHLFEQSCISQKTVIISWTVFTTHNLSILYLLGFFELAEVPWRQKLLILQTQVFISCLITL